MSQQWVLIRGIVSESYHWWDFVTEMKVRFPKDILHTPDIIGNGKFYEQATPWGAQANIKMLRNQIPTPGKKILVGFSLGGMLALEWAYAHPEEVEAVILINSSLNNSPIYKRLRPHSLFKILSFSQMRDHIKREESILKMTTSLDDEKIKTIAPAWGARSLTYPLQPTNFIRQLFLAGQMSQRKNPPNVPILVLTSAKDKVVHFDCSKKIALNWNLPLHIHPTAGHDLFLDDPHWVLNQMDQFRDQQNLLQMKHPGIDLRSKTSGDIENPKCSNSPSKDIHSPMSTQ